MAFVFCQIMASSGSVFADVNDFYFKDFTADYYVSKDAKGVSRMRVVENLTAVFPNFRQNKGICREIPYTNQGGVNPTLEALTRANLKLLRNGIEEPIYSIEKEDGLFKVCTGSDDYVLGEQVYTFEYSFSKVVTDFSDHQELYWDTNGNGWIQRFNSLTARVHFDSRVLDDLTGEAWCYVGKYGDSGQNRCTISRTDDGFSFSANDLAAGENLTFDIEISAGTFNVPAPKKNFIFVFFTIAVATCCFLALVYAIWMYFKNGRKKEKFYKGLFVKPEYQPHDKYSLEEMGTLYIGKKEDVKTAMLLELIVRKKISLIRDDDKPKSRKWSILINSLEDVSSAEMKLLMILNGGNSVSVGDVIKVKTYIATSRLAKLGTEMSDDIASELKKDGLVEGKDKVGWVFSVPAMVVVAIFGYFPAIAFFTFIAAFGALEIFGLNEFVGEFVGKQSFMISSLIMILLTTIIYSIFRAKTKKFKNYTTEGLKMSRYMDGLKLYIKMAEKERLEFLQGVKNVDVSPDGVVKMYEKLLPYAAVFGLEESWLNELSKYCQVNEISEPSYLMAGVVASDFSRATRSIVKSANSSVSISSSGSGISGGGGGGFSGGGGGGGGGFGR